MQVAQHKENEGSKDKHKQNDPFTLRGKRIEDVESLTYLRSVVAKDGGATQDVAR